MSAGALRNALARLRLSPASTTALVVEAIPRMAFASLRATPLIGRPDLPRCARSGIDMICRMKNKGRRPPHFRQTGAP